MSIPFNIATEELKKLRREVLHRHPELSGKEKETARRIAAFLQNHHPYEIHQNIGGHGLMAIYQGAQAGPTVVIRCELDALPIAETIDLPHASQHEGVAHKCGHDGHMSMVAGLAPLLHDNPLQKGKVVLLFQPAEETGQGARRVANDEVFKKLNPDWIFAVHNLPGFPVNQVVYREGAFNPAVNSLIVKYTGHTSHAAEPEKGLNPALAMAELLQKLITWNEGDSESATFTVIAPVHQLLGDKAYGTSAGYGESHFTLRSDTAEKMRELEQRAEELARNIGNKHELKTEISWTESFEAGYNHPDAVAHIAKAAQQLGLNTHEVPRPFRWGEDFGHFTQHYRGAMFCLGAGNNHPSLHHPHYDFNDDLLEPGVAVFYKIIRNILHV